MTTSTLTKEEKVIVQVYSNLMEEAKARLGAISVAASGSTGLPPAIANEFCFLQLRCICELIGLGCLVAHGDIPAARAKKVMDQYMPGAILSTLTQLNPDFYPFPTIILDRGSHKELTLLKDGNFLKKNELISLHGKCGDVLHRGTLQKLLSTSASSALDYKDSVIWAQKIRDLLNIHVISRLSGSPLICMMSHLPSGGKVFVSLAAAI
jgi:hypothetical protein